MGDVLKRSTRWILKRTLTPHTWEEKTQRPVLDPEAGIVGGGGGGGDGGGDQGGNERTRSMAVRGTHTSALIPANDKLLVFRSLTGIDTVPALTSNQNARRVAPNVGIYPRVVRAERLAARNYHIFNMLVNTCLAVQFVIGASLTALGASRGSSSAVAAFGAINTIIAGILTYLKGSGVPERFKNVEEGFKAVREYAEQREREFCLFECPLDPFDEVQAVDDMYHSAAQQWSGNKGAAGGNAGAGVGASAVHTAPGMVTSAVSSLAHRFAKRAEQTTMPASQAPPPAPAR